MGCANEGPEEGRKGRGRRMQSKGQAFLTLLLKEINCNQKKKKKSKGPTLKSFQGRNCGNI